MKNSMKIIAVLPLLACSACACGLIYLGGQRGNWSWWFSAAIFIFSTGMFLFFVLSGAGIRNSLGSMLSVVGAILLILGLNVRILGPTTLPFKTCGIVMMILGFYLVRTSSGGSKQEKSNQTLHVTSGPAAGPSSHEG